MSDEDSRPLIKLLSAESKAAVFQKKEALGNRQMLEWLSVKERAAVFPLVDSRLQTVIMTHADANDRAQMFVEIAPDPQEFIESKKQGWFATKGQKEVLELLEALPAGEDRALMFLELSQEHQAVLVGTVSGGDRAEIFTTLPEKLSLNVPVTSDGQYAMVHAGSAKDNAEMYGFLSSKYQGFMLVAMTTKGKAAMFQALSLEQQTIMCSQLSVEERDDMLTSMPNQF